MNFKNYLATFSSQENFFFLFLNLYAQVYEPEILNSTVYLSCLSW